MIKFTPQHIATIATSLLLVITGVLILLVVPFTEDFMGDTKQVVMFGGTLLFGLFYAVITAKRGTIDFFVSKVTLVVFLLLLAVTASTVITQPYPIQGVLSLGGMMIAGLLLVLFSSTLLGERSWKVWLQGFAGVTALLTILSLAELTPAAPSHVVTWMLPLFKTTGLSFNLAGSLLTAAQLTLLSVVGLSIYLWQRRKLVVWALALLVINVVGLGVFTAYSTPWVNTSTAALLPNLSASWSVTLDSLREPRAAIIGAGTNGYRINYQQYKPLWVNGTPQWGVIFTTASNAPLMLLVSTGFLGLLCWIFLIVSMVRTAKEHQQLSSPIVIMLLVSFFAQLFLPLLPLIFAIQAMLIALFLASCKNELPMMNFSFMSAKISNSKRVEEGHKTSRWPAVITAGILVAALIWASAQTFFVYAGQYYAFRSQQALSGEQPNIESAYRYQQQAVQSSPYLDSIRRRYASLSITIASLLAQKTNRTKEDEALVSQLISQAVREARNAAALNEKDAQNWLLLANIYQQLIGSVDGADTFAIQNYVQGINLLPQLPDAYINLAGIYIQKKEYQQAASVLQQALNVKADYPNTLFNLAFVAEQLGDFINAKALYERTRTTITDQNTAEYAQVTKKIEELAPKAEELQKKLDEQAKQQQAAQQQQQGKPESVQPAAQPKGEPEVVNAKLPVAPDTTPSAVDLNLNREKNATDVALPTAPQPTSAPVTATPVPTPAP